MCVVKNCKSCDLKDVCWEVPEDASAYCGGYKNKKQDDIEKCVNFLKESGWLEEHDKYIISRYINESK